MFRPQPRRLAAALLCLGLLGGAGCSASQPPESTDAPGESSASDSTPPSALPPTGAPTEPPYGDEFSLDEVARFDDELSIEVGAPLRETARDTDTGAEGTDGQILTISVTITNESPDPYDASRVLVLGYYGQVGAPKVRDADGVDFQIAFSGEIAPGEDDTATFGFAMPRDQLDEIQIVVDPDDDIHDPVRFVGSA